MRIIVDNDLCQGHTLCALAAPDLFGLRDDDGHSYVLADPVPAGLHEAARRAVLSCPEGAIAILETGEADGGGGPEAGETEEGPR